MSHDGRQLAVKVQHVGLRDTCAADTVIVEAFVKGLRWMFPDFNYQWLIDELKESVPKVLLGVQCLRLLAEHSGTTTLICIMTYLCCSYQSMAKVTGHTLPLGRCTCLHLSTFLSAFEAPLCILPKCAQQHAWDSTDWPTASAKILTVVTLPFARIWCTELTCWEHEDPAVTRPNASLVVKHIKHKS